MTLFSRFSGLTPDPRRVGALRHGGAVASPASAMSAMSVGMHGTRGNTAGAMARSTVPMDPIGPSRISAPQPDDGETGGLTGGLTRTEAMAGVQAMARGMHPGFHTGLLKRTGSGQGHRQKYEGMGQGTLRPSPLHFAGNKGPRVGATTRLGLLLLFMLVTNVGGATAQATMRPSHGEDVSTGEQIDEAQWQEWCEQLDGLVNTEDAASAEGPLPQELAGRLLTLANQNYVMGEPDQTQWQLVSAVWSVTDETVDALPELMALNESRADALAVGATNPNVPYYALEEALYTGGLSYETFLSSGGTLSGPALATRNALAEAMWPYSQHLVVDVVDEDAGTATRQLVAPDELDEFKDDQPNDATVIVRDYRELASFWVTRLGHRPTNDRLLEQLMAMDWAEPEAAGDIGEMFWVLGTAPGVDHATLTGFVEDFVFPGLDSGDYTLRTGVYLAGIAGDEKTAANKTDGLVAQSILYLARQGYPADVLEEAIVQWANHLPDLSVSTKSKVAMLEAVLLLAQEDDRFVPVVDDLLVAMPSPVSYLLLRNIPLHGPLRDTHTALLQYFDDHPEAMFEWIDRLYEGGSPGIFGDYPDDAQLDEFLEDNHEDGLELALTLMASNRDGRYVDILREVVELTSDPENQKDITINGVNFNTSTKVARLRNMALAGLVAQQDTDTMLPVLGFAASDEESSSKRGEALSWAMILEHPGWLSQVPHGESSFWAQQFSPAAVAPFTGFDAQGRFELTDGLNPFTRTVQQGYYGALEAWHYSHQGMVPMDLAAIPPDMQLWMYQDSLNAQFPAGGDYWLRMGQDPAFMADYVAPYLEQIEDEDIKFTAIATQDRIVESPPPEPDFLPLVLLWFTKTGYTDASPLIQDMIQNPGEYAPTVVPSPMQPYDIIESVQLLGVQSFALEALGGTLAGGDTEGMDLLLRGMQSPSTVLQRSAFRGMDHYTRLYRFTITHGTQQEQLAIRNQVGSQVLPRLMEIRQWVSQGPSPTLARDIPQEEYLFQINRQMIALGGTSLLLDEVAATLNSGQTEPSAMIRATAHALLSEGYTPDDLDQMGYPSDWLRYFQDVEYFVGQAFRACQNAVPGYGDHLHVDSGFAFDPMGLGLTIEYPPSQLDQPENHVRPDSVMPHSSATLYNYATVARPNGRILSIDYAHQPVNSPYDTFYVDPVGDLGLTYLAGSGGYDSFRHELETAIEGQLRGDYRFRTANYSFVLPNYRVTQQAYLDGFLNQLSVRIALLGELGVTNMMSSGNFQGESRAMFPGLGSMSPLGNQVDGSGQIAEADGVVIVSAIDGYFRTIAPFGSTNDSLDETPAKLMAAPGVRELSIGMDQTSGRFILMPADGTSFASPNLGGAVYYLKSLRESLGLPEWTEAQWEEALDQASQPLPGHQEWEGEAVNPSLLLYLAIQENPDDSIPLYPSTTDFWYQSLRDYTSR